MLITVAKAAQVLGLKSRGSIYRKVKSGELETTTGPDGAPWIERDGLEERWQQMTREQKNSPKPLRPAAERVKPTSTRTVRVVESDVPDYNEERARHEREKRMLAELARQEKERELLRRDDVTAVVRARIPHLEIDEVEVITQLIREALEELSAGEVQA